MLFVTKPDIRVPSIRENQGKNSSGKSGKVREFMYRCHPYHFLEIYKPLVNEPIGSYQIQHLNLNTNLSSRKLGNISSVWKINQLPWHWYTVTSNNTAQPYTINNLIDEDIPALTHLPHPGMLSPFAWKSLCDTLCLYSYFARVLANWQTHGHTHRTDSITSAQYRDNGKYLVCQVHRIFALLLVNITSQLLSWQSLEHTTQILRTSTFV